MDPVALHCVCLPFNQRSLIVFLSVANLKFQKQVVARFTRLLEDRVRSGHYFL